MPCFISTTVYRLNLPLPLTVLKVIHQGKCHIQSHLHQAHSIGDRSLQSQTIAPNHSCMRSLIKHKQIIHRELLTKYEKSKLKHCALLFCLSLLSFLYFVVSASLCFSSVFLSYLGTKQNTIYCVQDRLTYWMYACTEYTLYVKLFVNVNAASCSTGTFAHFGSAVWHLCCIFFWLPIHTPNILFQLIPEDLVFWCGHRSEVTLTFLKHIGVNHHSNKSILNMCRWAQFSFRFCGAIR